MKEDEIFELEIAVQDGVEIEVVGGRVKLKIDAEMTKRDLWKSQIELFFSKNEERLETSFLRITNNNKLKFVKSKY